MIVFKQMLRASAAAFSWGRARSGGEPAACLWAQCVHAAACHADQPAQPSLPLRIALPAKTVPHPKWVGPRPAQVTRPCLGMVGRGLLKTGPGAVQTTAQMPSSGAPHHCPIH